MATFLSRSVVLARHSHYVHVTFQAHAVRVFGGLDICISLLNDPDTLNAELSHLHDQHDERGIPHEYFDVSFLFTYCFRVDFFSTLSMGCFDLYSACCSKVDVICAVLITTHNKRLKSISLGIPSRIALHHVRARRKLRPGRLDCML